MKRDVLAELDRLIKTTPDGNHVCAPLKRSMVVAIADEIRRLRAIAASRDPFEYDDPDQIRNALAAMDNKDQPKPKPAQRPSKSHNAKG